MGDDYILGNKELGKRISELEKNLRQALDNNEANAHDIKGIEIWRELHKSEPRGEVLLEGIELLNKEIAELRAKISLDKSKQLNELKEDVERCNIQDGEIATVLHLKTDNIIEDVNKRFYEHLKIDFASHQEIREVLRDHLESHKFKATLQKAGEEDWEKIPKINATIDEQIAKLDGSEKKASGDEKTDEEFFDSELQAELDSEGEKKSIRSSVVDRSKRETRSGDDSKPPEPNCINRDMVECPNRVCPCDVFESIYERVRDATRQEPRENDVKTFMSGSFEKELISEFVKKLREIPEHTPHNSIYNLIKEYEDKLK